MEQDIASRKGSGIPLKLAWIHQLWGVSDSMSTNWPSLLKQFLDLDPGNPWQQIRMGTGKNVYMKVSELIVSLY